MSERDAEREMTVRDKVNSEYRSQSGVVVESRSRRRPHRRTDYLLRFPDGNELWFSADECRQFGDLHTTPEASPASGSGGSR